MNFFRSTIAIVTTACALGAQTPFQTKPQSFSIQFETNGKQVTVTVRDKKAKVYMGNKLLSSVQLGNQAVRVTDPSGNRLLSITGWPNKAPMWAARRANLGVNVREIDSALAAHLGLDRKSCVIVASVQQKQAAAKAGIKKHDIITRIEDDEKITRSKLSSLVAKKKPGDVVEVEVLRQGRTKTFEVKLGTIAFPHFGSVRYPQLNLSLPKSGGSSGGGLYPRGQSYLKSFPNRNKSALFNLKAGGIGGGAGGRWADTAKPDLGKEVDRLHKELARLQKLLQNIQKDVRKRTPSDK